MGCHMPGDGARPDVVVAAGLERHDEADGAIGKERVLPARAGAPREQHDAVRRTRGSRRGAR